jgi:hypothetical protein
MPSTIARQFGRQHADRTANFEPEAIAAATAPPMSLHICAVHSRWFQPPLWIGITVVEGIEIAGRSLPSSTSDIGVRWRGSAQRPACSGIDPGIEPGWRR